MHRAVLAAIVLAVLCVADPLRAQDAPSATASAALPDAALPPDLERVLRDYERAWRSGDAAALASLFAEDGFVLQSNRPPIRGRDAIQAAYAGQGGAPLRLRALAYSAEENHAYIIGGYRYGDAPADIGKFTLTLRRTPGQPWLIFSDMDNANAPPKPRPAGAP